MKQVGQQINFVTFAVITFVFVLAWTGFSIYDSATTSSITPQLQQDIKPINGTFDLKTISNITARKNVEPLSEAVASSSATATPIQSKITAPKALSGGKP